MSKRRWFAMLPQLILTVILTLLGGCALLPPEQSAQTPTLTKVEHAPQWSSTNAAKTASVTPTVTVDISDPGEIGGVGSPPTLQSTPGPIPTPSERAIQPSMTSNTRMSSLTPSPTWNTTPVSSSSPTPTRIPRGEEALIAYTSRHEEARAVCAISLDGTRVRLTEDGEQGWYPKWSPDGEMIAFLTNTYEEPQLEVLSVHGREFELLIQLPDVSSFTWSRDGKAIAFSSSEPVGRHRYGTFLLMLADPRPSLFYESDLRVADLFWSPSGDDILTLGRDHKDFPFVYIVNLNGEAQGLYLRAWPTTVTWDPTGRKVAYDNVSGAFDQLDIHVVDLDDMSDKPLTHMEQFSHALQWSPVGDRIAFESSSTGTPPAVFVAEIDDDEVFQVSPSNVKSVRPSWSSDGKHLLFLTATDTVEQTGYSLNMYSFETGEIKRLVDANVVGIRPMWQP